MPPGFFSGCARATVVPEDLSSELQSYAEDSGKTVSRIIYELIAFALSEIPEIPEYLNIIGRIHQEDIYQQTLSKLMTKMKRIGWDETNLQKTLDDIDKMGLPIDEEEELIRRAEKFSELSKARKDDLYEAFDRLSALAEKKKQSKKSSRGKKKISKKELINWILDKQEKLGISDGYTRKVLNEETTSALMKIKREWSECARARGY